MITRGSVAKKVRERKETHPEEYCKNPKCLWNTKRSRCQKHDPLLMEIREVERKKEIAIAQRESLGSDFAAILNQYDQLIVDLKAKL